MSESAEDNSSSLVSKKDVSQSDDIANDSNVLNGIRDGSYTDLRQEALRAYLSLDKSVKRRVVALKKLQKESFDIEAQFFKKMNDLEKEFEAQHSVIFARRKDIVLGEVEPNEEECDWPEDEIEELAIANEVKENALNDNNAPARGIPDFWLTIFKNVQLLTSNKEESDDPILSHLIDIKTNVTPSDSPRPGFILSFYFTPNEYFTDTVLRKEYFVRFGPSTSEPLSFDGPEIIEAKGCNIHWKPNKNVTVRTIKKTMRHKNRGDKKTVTKTVKTNSFFNFFDPPKGSLDSNDIEDLDEGVVSELQADFELGQFIREQVVPRAVLLFTGEGIEADDDDEDYDSECEEDDENDNTTPEKSSKHHRNRGSSNNSQQECKQQ